MGAGRRRAVLEGAVHGGAFDPRAVGTQELARRGRLCALRVAVNVCRAGAGLPGPPLAVSPLRVCTGLSAGDPRLLRQCGGGGSWP